MKNAEWTACHLILAGDTLRWNDGVLGLVIAEVVEIDPEGVKIKLRHNGTMIDREWYDLQPDKNCDRMLWPDEAAREAEVTKQAELRFEVWRKGRVAVYNNVREIRMHDFKVNFDKLEGTFRAAFDEQECPDEFPFGFDHKGTYHVGMPCIPYHHTELLTVVETTPEAVAALRKAINDIFPDVKPYGNGIIWNTPIVQRLPSPEALEKICKSVGKPGFEWRIKVTP